MIVRCKAMVIENIKKERMTQGVDVESIEEEAFILGKTLSFGQIGKACIGKPGLLAVNISVMVTQFGFTIGYFIFMGNTLRSILKYFIVPEHHWEPIVHNFTTPNAPIITTTSSPNFTTTTSSPNFTTTTMSTTASNISSLFSLDQITDLGLVNTSTVLNFLHHHMANLRETVKSPWSASNLVGNSTITFAVLILFPLPILILISFVRNLRKLGPISVIANVSITGAGLATAIYMLSSKSNY